MSARRRLLAVSVLTLLLAACGGEDATPDGGDRRDGGGAGSDGSGGGDDGGSAGTDGGRSRDAGPRPDGGVRGVTSPEVLFEGTELDLDRQYGLYIQDDGSSIDIVDDPLGEMGSVIRFRDAKRGDWTHTMVRPADMRTGYRDPAQIVDWEVPYHYVERMLVTPDPQLETEFYNLLEDFHCEPCEANDLQIVVNWRRENTLCLWIAYSTDAGFDPRGTNRGSSFDPWPDINGNATFVTIAADGTSDLPSSVPPTGALLLCREDVHLADLAGRWVDVEMVVRPSSYDTGVVMLWIDDHLYRYDGPNSYRWNQDSSGSLPVNTFQIGLYGGSVTPASGTADYFELFATPPRIELGTDIL